MHNRYSKLFSSTSAQRRSALIPFAMIGLNGQQKFLEWIDVLVENGADALELGIPFSDPVADGLIIQQAAQSALQQGIQVEQAFALIAKIRTRCPEIPIGLLVYANLVIARSATHFFQTAQHSGVDSILIADVPVHMGAEFECVAHKTNIASVYIATMESDTDRLKMINAHSPAFVYMVSRPGVTGADRRPDLSCIDLSSVRKYLKVPIVVGFGIDGGKTAFDAARKGFDGVVVGSALVKLQMSHQVPECVSLMRELSESVRRIA